MTSNTDTQEPAPSAPGEKNSARPVLIGVSIVAVAALVAAVWFGIGWGRALFVDKPIADTRDSALTGAQQVAINLNTVDASDIDQSFENMKSSITGDSMLNDLSSTQSSISDDVRNSGAKGSAELLHGTLTELSADEGTATALVVIATTTTWPNRPAVKNMLTLRLFMEDVDGTWKANKVDPVGTGIALDNGAVDPNAVPVQPNAVPANPDAVPVDPNAVPVDPGATPSTVEAPAAVPDATGGP